MRKFISITISLCLLFCSFVPVYAESWTTQQATLVTQGTTGILSMLTQLRTDIVEWLTLTASGGQGLGATFQDQYILLSHLADWLVPTGARGANDPTLMDSIVVLTNYAMTHLPDISVISGYVYSWMNANNTYLLRLNNALTNMGSYTTFNSTLNAHSQLPFTSGPWYSIIQIDNNGNSHLNSNYSWSNGSPLGNIALMLWNKMDNESKIYNYRWTADLKHYNDTLSTWDSQGSTLTQVNFTPESAIQGLYRYLAFTQRDVARLTHVLASDEEIEVREKAQANQDTVLDNFIDSNGSGTVSDTSFSDVAGASDSFKDNFNTGVSGSSIWNVFDNSRYNWFTQNTKNQLDTTPQTRNATDYPTPLLDTYYSEIFSVLGVNIND